MASQALQLHPGAADLTALTAADAARRIAEGEITSEALVTACLERIAQTEETVGAWAHLDAELALAQARQADQWRRQGHMVGPLHGVPVGIKDIIDTADLPTENGTAIHAGRQPGDDAAAVQALRDAGAVTMGKTVTTELAVFHPGKTRNPHNPEHTPGGSSSGSAAAVASGMVPLAVGSQTNGSMLRPAAYCGVFGLKPTFGLISRSGVLSQSPPLDTLGVFARTLEDLGLIADCLTAFDARDTAMWPRSRPRLRDTAMGDVPVTPMLAFVKSPVWDHADDVTKEAFAELADVLGEQCDEVELPEVFDKTVELHRTIMLADIAKSYGPLHEKAPDKISGTLAGMIEEGRSILAVDYNLALEWQSALYAGLEQVFERYDAIVTPSAPGPAPKGLDATGSPIFNTLWTYTGVPAVNLPILEADGLPLGVQLVGPRREDGRLLRTASWLVRHLAEDD
ncbi:MAG: amidase [Methyloligellaceae bacterium]